MIWGKRCSRISSSCRRTQQPTVILFGLRPDTMEQLIENTVQRLRDGVVYTDGTEDDELLQGYTCTFKSVREIWYDVTVKHARWFYGGSAFPLLQLTGPIATEISVGFEMPARGARAAAETARGRYRGVRRRVVAALIRWPWAVTVGCSAGVLLPTAKLPPAYNHAMSSNPLAPRSTSRGSSRAFD